VAKILRETARLLTAATVLLACAPAAQSQDLKALEKDLEANLKGKVLTLKRFGNSNWLRFDAEGQLLDSGSPVPWTLYSKFEVTDVRLRSQKLEINGNRMFVRFDENQQMLHLRTKERVTVEVSFESGKALDSQVRATLPTVFLGSGESLALYVPECWHSFLAPETVSPRKRPSERAEELLRQHPERVRVASGVAEAKNISRTPPRYPDVARRGRIGGTVVLDAIIGTDGSMQEIRIKQPAGMGLDEAAIEAVQQWKYSPTMLMGVPVEVETVIKVVFKAY
jgi:TonB family protein